MAGLARFERHHSTSSENAAVAFKVFLFQFINTALVTLVCTTGLRGRAHRGAWLLPCPAPALTLVLALQVVFARMPNGVQVPGQSTFNYFSVRWRAGSVAITIAQQRCC